MEVQKRPHIRSTKDNWPNNRCNSSQPKFTRLSQYHITNISEGKTNSTGLHIFASCRPLRHSQILLWSRWNRWKKRVRAWTEIWLDTWEIHSGPVTVFLRKHSLIHSSLSELGTIKVIIRQGIFLGLNLWLITWAASACVAQSGVYHSVTN